MNVKPLCSIFLCLFISTISYSQFYNKAFEIQNSPYEDLISTQNSIVIDANDNAISVHSIRTDDDNPLTYKYDGLVIKVDVNGQELWTKRIGTLDYDEKLNAICIMDNGDLLIAGTKENINLQYENWIIRLDGSGNTIWSNTYDNASLNCEGLAISRTNEALENYFIAGRSFTPDRITAMKIHASGTLHWYNRYINVNAGLEPSTQGIQERVSTIVQDITGNGFIVAGLFGQNVNFNSFVFPEAYVFAIGIDLDGEISKDFMHSYYGPTIGIEAETLPHIIQNFDQNGYVMAYGLTMSKVEEPPAITILNLDLNLVPQIIFKYPTESGRPIRASSIHKDPTGYYAISCTEREFLSSQLIGTQNRASFLKVDATFNPDTYYKYNLGVDADCTFMARNTNGNYVLKSDNYLQLSYTNGGSFVGLMQTDQSGLTACAELEQIERIGKEHFHIRMDHYKEIIVPIKYPQQVYNMPLNPGDLSCASFPSVPNGSMQSPNLNQFDLLQEDHKITGLKNKVFPSIINTDQSVTLTNDDLDIISLQIISVSGQNLFEENSLRSLHTNTISIAGKHFAFGMNFIVIQKSNGSREVVKIIKN